MNTKKPVSISIKFGLLRAFAPLVGTDASRLILNGISFEAEAGGRVQILFYDPYQACSIHLDGDESFVGFLMPLKLDGTPTIPTWAKELQPAT